jgi:3',5'-cyclic AMP phosphodiesterase CpdA
MIRRLVFVLCFAATLAAQTFIQMSDPQFGMFSKNENFRHETVNFNFAIATANRLKPDFVVITGDLINDGASTAQAAEYKRIAAKIDSKIPLYAMPGNHDMENEPTKETVARYRSRMGRDYYSFRSGAMAGVVLNSSLEKAPEKVQDEAAKMEEWLRAELKKLRADGVRNIIVFQHIPFFITDPGEPDSYDNIPLATRKRYLDLLKESGVRYVFSGHYHANAGGHDGELEQIVSGPVGLPLRGAQSGLRIATVSGTGAVTHKYYQLGEIPEALTSQ